jgi:ABC-type amino acid transport substrate-binding protein
MIPYEGETVTSYPLIFWEKIPEHIHQLEDIQTIANAVVCVEPGSSQESFLGQYKNLFIIKEVSPFIALLEIKSGKALAILLQDNLFKEFKIKYPQLVALQIPIDEQHQILGNGIGIKKENQLLIQQITTIINDLKKDGKMVFLKHKWLK